MKNYIGNVIIILIFIISNILGMYFKRFDWGRYDWGRYEWVKYVLFIISIVAFIWVVYYIGFRQFSTPANNYTDKIIYQESAKSHFSWIAFLLVVGGTILTGWGSILCAKGDYRVCAIIFGIVFVGGLLVLSTMIFFRDISVVFSEDAIIFKGKNIIYPNGKTSSLNYNKIDKFSVDDNVLRIYPVGQKFFGDDYFDFVTPYEIDVNNPDKIEEILNQKIKNN